MSSIVVKFDTKRFRQAVAKAPQLAAAKYANALTLIGLQFRTHMVETRLSGPPGLSAQTGELRKSLDAHTYQDAKGVAVLIGFYGPGGISARIHEFGGTIHANGKHSKCGKGKYLAIPLPAAKTGNGRLRLGPCEFGEHDFKKNHTGLLLIRSKKGNLLLVQVKAAGVKNVRHDPKRVKLKKGLTPLSALSSGERDRIVPMFVLKKSVNVAARLGFVRTFREFHPRAMRRLEKATEEILAGMKGGAA